MISLSNGRNRDSPSAAPTRSRGAGTVRPRGSLFWQAAPGPARSARRPRRRQATAGQSSRLPSAAARRRADFPSRPARLLRQTPDGPRNTPRHRRGAGWRLVEQYSRGLELPVGHFDQHHVLFGEELDIAITVAVCLLAALPQGFAGRRVIAKSQPGATNVVPGAGDSAAVLQRLSDLQVGAKALDGPLVPAGLQLHAPQISQ